MRINFRAIRRFAILGAVALGGVIALPTRAATVITQWNFNTTTGANNTPGPSTGSGTASSVGMTGGPSNDILKVAGDSSLGVTTTSDPLGTAAADDEWRIRGVTNNGWSGTALTSGAKFTASTAGNSNVVVNFDIFGTGGGPRFAQFEYTTDGSTFTPFGAPFDLSNATTPLNAGWTNGVTFDLTGVAGVDNNANFGFEILSTNDPIAFTDSGGSHAPNTAIERADQDVSKTYNPTSGNWRFDMVTVSSAPEPASIGLAGFAAIGLLGRRRSSI